MFPSPPSAPYPWFWGFQVSLVDHFSQRLKNKFVINFGMYFMVEGSLLNHILIDILYV